MKRSRQTLILSHPFLGNYGGMLQSYALYIVTQNLNINSFIACYNKQYKGCLLKRIIRFLVRYLASLYSQSRIEKETHRIARAFQKITSSKKISLNNSCQYIVGSDQVWRAKYARWLHSLPFFFIDFATVAQRKRSISYAASFGSDEWEGTPEETDICRSLLQQFKAVSVREHSGVKICKDVFGVKAVQMPDPTLLLRSENYSKIIEREKTWLPKSKYIAVYVLDESERNAELLRESSRAAAMQLQHLMSHSDAKQLPISVPQWLRLIRDCEYFITDSFHGCVFAIIYNKPFVSLGNEGRGNARFDTLLGTFGLEDRLVTDATPEKVMRTLNTPIDWERINVILDSERERGIKFLKENLT